MAGQRKPDGPQKALKQDELVEKMVPDPSQAPSDLTVLTGLLGKSTKAGYWRLYTTSRFNEYLEIGEADIVHSESLSSDRNPQGGTRLWVIRDAKLRHTRTESRQVEAEFLQGKITAEFLPRANAQYPQPAGPAAGRADWSARGYCYSAGEYFCTWGQPCTQRIITCTDKVQAVVHRTEIVACTPRDDGQNPQTGTPCTDQYNTACC
jgi:hypothetical protein